MSSVDDFFGQRPFTAAVALDQARQAQYANNKARQAWSYARLTTEGSGEFQLSSVVPFSAVFAAQPDVAHGFALAPDTEPLVPYHFPRVSGGVYRWQRDARGMYVGAYVFVTVDTVGLDSLEPAKQLVDVLAEPRALYHLEHSFTFSGLAVKSLPDSLLGA